MRIVHFSDPHAGGGAEDFFAYFDKRAVGVFNYKFRRQFRHDLTKLSRAVEYILDAKPDVAVCTGDLTSTGQPGEFEKVRPILAPLRDSGIPLLYLPGNHDCYVKRAKCVGAVREMTAYLSKDDYRFTDLPLQREYANVEFLLLNTSRPSNLLCSWGFVDKRDAKWVGNVCEEPKNTPRILLSHYPMIEEHPILRMRHRLFGQKRILELMNKKKIDLSLCGHVHKPYLKVDSTGRGECCAGSVSRNGSMVEIDYSPETDQFTFRTVTL
ncbi:MAG: metallophosphoesterase [Victivallales bacterium]|jgi:3',5'-cyclic AMP phosphodiesterase CpdA|nr:metallophosphoesterase [Victivallales bacterium]